LGLAAAVDGFLVEPHAPVAEKLDISLRRLPDAFREFRIVQLSDFHVGPYVAKAQVEHAVELTRSLRPDLVILTGDFVSHSLFETNGPAGARHAEPCAETLAPLTNTPIVAILGNHDHWNDPEIVTEILESHHISVLRNRSIPLERDGQRIWIAGVDDVLEGASDLDHTLASIPSGETTIVAVHEPDFADEVARRAVDLQLSGHTHGGQFRIPGIGALILPELGRKYSSGLYRVRDLQLYTNRGIGVITPPVRFHCPPEVTLLTLTGKA